MAPGGEQKQSSPNQDLGNPPSMRIMDKNASRRTPGGGEGHKRDEAKKRTEPTFGVPGRRFLKTVVLTQFPTAAESKGSGSGTWEGKKKRSGSLENE